MTSAESSDVASVNPRLCGVKAGSFYGNVARARRRLVTYLQQTLELDAHFVYVAPSVTAAIHGLMIGSFHTHGGWLCADEVNHAYEGLRSVLIEHGLNSRHPSRFVTHVSPHLGKVSQLNRCGRLIVDGAQSAGTVLHRALVHGADVSIFPLHKHIGLTPGIAIVAVSQAAALSDEMHEVMAALDKSVHSLDEFERANAVADKLRGQIFNKAIIRLTQDQSNLLKRHGFRLLGDLGHSFVCITPINKSPVQTKLAAASWKLHMATNSARFSYCIPGRLDDPQIDVSELFLEDLKSLVSGR